MGLSKVAHHTKLGGPADLVDGYDAIQTNSKDLRSEPMKTQGVHQGQVHGPAPGSGQSWYQYKPGGSGWIEGSPEEKGLAVLVEEKLDMVWQCVLAAQKGKHIPSCTKSSMVSRLREIIFPIYSLLF